MRGTIPDGCLARSTAGCEPAEAVAAEVKGCVAGKAAACGASTAEEDTKPEPRAPPCEETPPRLPTEAT